MTRGKQKKNGTPFANSFTKEEGRGRCRGGKRGGKSSIQIFGEVESRESKPVGVGATLGGRGRKRGESFQIKYSRRYDDLVQSEPVYQAEISNPMSLRPPNAKRKSPKRIGIESHNDAVRDSEAVNVESSLRKNGGAQKTHKVRRYVKQSYNTTVYNYMDGEIVRTTATTEEVHSSDMDATPEVVLPASENWAEVVLDRGGNHGTPVASYTATEASTWGLGYVKEETGEMSADEMSKEIATAQKLDGHHVQALSGSNSIQMGYSRGEEYGQPMKSRKGKHKAAPKEVVYSKRRPGKDENTRGFLSRGGLKIFTNDVSDTSEDQDSCTDQMEGFADDDDGYIGCSRKFERGKKRNKDLIARKEHLSSPDPKRFSAIMLDSSDGDEGSESSDSEISDELVDDYLANCEGLSADIDDPSWVSRNQKALEYPFIDEMDILHEESGSSEELYLDEDSNGSARSGSELEDDVKHRCKVTACSFGRQVIRKRRSEETTLRGDSDVEVEDLEQKVFFGYDSDTSSSGEDKEDALLSDDEVRIRDLDLDDEARIRDLGQKDNASASAKDNLAPKYRAVGGFVSGPAEDVQLTSSVATQTWPVSTGKTVKKSKGVPGQKKRERQETIAAKRRERAVNRGFDLVAVNKELEEMVRLKKDIIAFAPMEQRDRAQVHRLASMYKLNSGSQGTTKRRFVVVSITKNTGMPSAEDRFRLLKLLGQATFNNAEKEQPRSSRTLTGEEQRKVSKAKRAARQAPQGVETPVSKKGSKNRYFSSSAVKTPNTISKGRSAEKSRGRNGKAASSGRGSHMKRSDKKASKTAVMYANNPVSFIGRGPESEDGCITLESTRSSTPASAMEGMVHPRSRADVGSSSGGGREASYIMKSNTSEFAVFEAHTNGFASRLMAKMGYVEGHGLGRDKQGLAQPLEAVMRPKSLGLGARM